MAPVAVLLSVLRMFMDLLSLLSFLHSVMLLTFIRKAQTDEYLILEITVVVEIMNQLLKLSELSCTSSACLHPFPRFDVTVHQTYSWAYLELQMCCFVFFSMHPLTLISLFELYAINSRKLLGGPTAAMETAIPWKFPLSFSCILSHCFNPLSLFNA